jgi:hypothetical protein
MRFGVVLPRERWPAEVQSLPLRRKYFYKVEQAGAQVRLSRTQAYRAADAGAIPTERYGRLLLVRKTVWDAEVRRLKRGGP